MGLTGILNQAGKEILVPFSSDLFKDFVGNPVPVDDTDWNVPLSYNGYKLTKLNSIQDGSGLYRVNIDLGSFSFDQDASVFNIYLPSGMSYSNLLWNFCIASSVGQEELVRIGTNNPDLTCLSLTAFPFIQDYFTISKSPWGVYLDFIAQISGEPED